RPRVPPEAAVVAVRLPDHAGGEAADEDRGVGGDVAALVTIDDVGVEQITAAAGRVAAGERVDVVRLRAGTPGGVRPVGRRAVQHAAGGRDGRIVDLVVPDVQHHQRPIVEA